MLLTLEKTVIQSNNDFYNTFFEIKNMISLICILHENYVTNHSYLLALKRFYYKVLTPVEFYFQAV